MEAGTASPRVLAIGAAEATGEVGLFADTVTLAEAGCSPLAVVTSVLTGASGVNAAIPVSSQVVGDQLRGLGDRPIAAVKVGTLPDVDVIRVLGGDSRLVTAPLVLDPDLAAFGSGGNRAWVRAYREYLLPIARVLVVDTQEGRQLCEMEVGGAELVRELLGFGCRWVILKGRATAGDEHEDVISNGTAWYAVRSARVGVTARGAGDIFSAGVAARLACNDDLPQAASGAREQVVSRLRRIQSAPAS